MSARERYIGLIVLTVLSFVYIMGSEVYDRWDGTVEEYRNYVEREKRKKNPEELEQEKARLLKRKQELLNAAMSESRGFEQSGMGVVEFLTRTARERRLRFESVLPAEPRLVGEFKEIGFRLTCAAAYHQLAKLVGDLESGPFAIRINRIALEAAFSGSSVLQANLDAKAFVLARGGTP